MTLTMLTLMTLLLVAGFPMMMPLLVAALSAFLVFMPGLSPEFAVQQMIGGVKPSSLIAIPMFIL
ncbi:MAG: TRAP transporter large permease, partial [Halomonas sp.]|nr:TRAP transporter large permease [Halomonas sp.]